jgi:uncharacterized membrane protein
MCIFFIFGSVRFVSVQLASSPPFPLPGVVSPSTDVVIPSRHVTLPSHNDTSTGTASRAARCGSFVGEGLGRSDVSNGGTWWRQKIYVVQTIRV